MESQTIQNLKTRLIQEQERLNKQIEQLEDTGLDDSLADSTSELSRYDNHPADLGSETFERSKDFALRGNERLLLSKVERALEDIAAGTYGYCKKCGNPISEDRLEAIPWAGTCLSCQEEDDRPDPFPRPLEEEILETPFYRTFLDRENEHRESVGFDGEDALQAVLRWGSSDSPQDIPGSHDYKSLYPDSEEHDGIVDPADRIPTQPRSKR
ncbi:zinc finger dksa/trar c4-type [Lucifera butyrica]|uniref:Zinc finger dksa/trar c4-type n=1 Tax=Lucifera butyrica TaxID=1351585 RepID=A0A498RAP2_9FIRM|nr:TraR/DksA C4-type zinc finger protein [Lucifera butyrica]VBB06178.1 zinc finger dksa/trar c4-type [Lucifera butyrica]